ncbi:bactofilin family protein [Marinobacterium weihaiense]|uniref:Polymer-forming cytoskeletal protein n=1 Tax=Marinobacterium weihaiense TaxID=2851016 RepID=A0ABS6M8L6_9GAMM|nr:polymer-forming cytoskeletal protein [Marinobacterium weihaiense]MBV0932231.1 polymer-forming cytoskeletal protein [Marinobacterium weihaiense]
MGILKRDVSAKPGRNAVTIIAQGNSLKGSMQVSGKVHVDGLFEGDIETADDITVGRKGELRGRIKARHVNVSGCVEGELNCDSLHIERGGRVQARLYCDALTIDPRGCFMGERRAREMPLLEYHPPEENAVEPPDPARDSLQDLDFSLIGSLPDRITLGRQED